ncbi:MAG: ATP-binding cassette domain-containing protein [Candidatus Eisenbacteria bacterium]|nr:ATP-binding cassette domain-containing protein [Candidatus Eisenbacteria bacterium]
MRNYLRLLRFVRPYWRRLLAALVCMTVFAVLSGASLGMILPFVNVLFEEHVLIEERARGGAGPPGDLGTAAQGSEAVEGRSGAEDSPEMGVVGSVQGLKDQVRERLLDFFRSDTAGGALRKISLALILVFLVKGVFGYLQSLLMITVEQGVIRDIRDALFRRISELSLSFFHGERTGRLISRITSDVTLVRRALVASLANLFRESLLTLLYLGVAIWISWKMALITFAVLPPIVIVMARIGQRLRKRSARIQERMADITSTLEEGIAGIRVVKAFGMEDYERRRFFDHTRSYFRTYVRMELLGALAGPLIEYLGVIGIVVILWYGGRQVLVTETVSPDWFIIFLAATLSTMQPLRKLSKANNELQVGMAAAGRIFHILDEKPAVENAPDAVRIDRFRDAIRYEDVFFRYDSGRDVLRDIGIEIRKGEVLAVVGPSGAGKSTLLDLLPRFYDPTEGRITLDGTDLRKVEIGSLRALMGIVTQETILFNDTVGNNIAYGLEGAGREEIEAAARAAMAHEFIEQMPEGYDTVIGERGVKLSGGQRQRIAIARAILKNPPILLFDEATSSLDTESERLVQDAIEHLLEGRTVLVIAHRLSTVTNADRTIVLDEGRIVETGTHQELMERGGLYRHLYDMQFRDEPER